MWAGKAEIAVGAMKMNVGRKRRIRILLQEQGEAVECPATLSPIQ
jgi:hypothetical protein